MRIQTFGALAVLGLLPVLASGQELSYDWIELQYVNTEIDTGAFEVDGDGFAIGGSFALTDAFQVIASYSDVGFDLDVDTTSFSVGAGYRYGVGEATDLVASLSYVSGEVESNFGDADDDGFALTAGLRSAVHEQIEVEGGVAYVDLDESGDETSLFGEGRYWFSDQFAAGIGVDLGDDATTFTISGRYNFGAARGAR